MRFSRLVGLVAMPAAATAVLTSTHLMPLAADAPARSPVAVVAATATSTPGGAATPRPQRVPAGAPAPARLAPAHGSASTAGRPSAPSPTPSSPSHGATSSTKPALNGLLVSMWYPGVNSVVTQLGGFIVGIPWSQVQPVQGGPLDTSSIDRVLQYARANGLRIKLRVTAGIDAPAWAKLLGGAPIAVSDPQAGVSGTAGRFWTAAFGQAYDALQAALASRYDGDPAVAEVVIDRCSTVYPEPFLRQAQNQSSVQSLLAAGYTLAADQACQQQEIDAHQAWTTTPSGLAFNPYDSIAADGSSSPDEAYTEQMMAYCRSSLGDRCVLENDSIRYPALGFDYAAMYQHMVGLGGDICFETALPSVVGDVVKTLQWAHGEAASAVEIPTTMPSATLPQMIAALAS